MEVKVKVIVNVQYITTITVPSRETSKGMDSILEYARGRGKNEYLDADERTTYSDGGYEQVTGVVAILLPLEEKKNDA